MPRDDKRKKKKKPKFKRDKTPLTAKSLRKRMTAGGDLAPMTGIATFGAGSTVVVTVAVAPQSDPPRLEYNLYAATDSATPSANRSAIANSPLQPPVNLMEGSGPYTAGDTLAVELTFLVGGYPRILGATVPANQVHSNNTSDPFTLS